MFEVYHPCGRWYIGRLPRANVLVAQFRQQNPAYSAEC